MLFKRVESVGLAHYSYVVGDGNEAIVIDPRRDVDVYVDLTHRAGYRLTHILETHRNEDYVVGSVALGARTGAAVWHADAQWDYRYGQPVTDGQSWTVGGLRVEALYAPGHTPGMMNYLLRTPDGAPWMLFSGDTLLPGDVGRVDLLGAERSAEMGGLLYDTLRNVVLPLGDSVILCPAHGSGSVCGASIADRPWTTIGLERRLNPALRAPDRETFIARQAGERERPPYFRRMERLNLEGPDPLATPVAPPPLPPREFSREAQHAVVLDTRPILGFAAGHVPGALSIWEEGLAQFAGWFLPYDRPLLLVIDGVDPRPVLRTLARIGYDNVAGYLAGGMHAWHSAGLDSAAIDTVTVPALCRWLDEGNSPEVLDVRNDAEIAREGAIHNARHIPITMLPARLDEAPRRRPLQVFCGSGRRSSIAASLLEREGWSGLRVVLGGTDAWTSISCPIDLVERE